MKGPTPSTSTFGNPLGKTTEKFIIESNYDVPRKQALNMIFSEKNIYGMRLKITFHRKRTNPCVLYRKEGEQIDRYFLKRTDKFIFQRNKHFGCFPEGSPKGSRRAGSKGLAPS